MDFVMAMNEGETAQKLLHNCENQKQALPFLTSGFPVYQPSNSDFRALQVFFEVDITQFHVDEIYGGRWAESSVVDYGNDVIMGTLTKFLDGTSFVKNILLADVPGECPNELPRKALE
jgi:hypothetical protein